MASQRGTYLRVGVLILAALGLGVGFLLFLTAGRLGQSAPVFETYLRESVAGLEVGSAVRYRGVQIGRVTEIALVARVYRPPPGAPPEGDFQRVLVRFNVDPSRLGETPDTESAVREGLRVRLASTGVTGVSYLELDFVDPNRFPFGPVPWTPQFPRVPSIPSTIQQVTNAAEALLAKLQTVPLDELFGGITGLVTDLRGQLNNGDLALTLREASTTLATIRAAVDNANLPALSADARALIGGPEVRGAVTNTAAAAAELRTAMARLPVAINSLEAAVRAARSATIDVNADLVPILRDLRAAVANLRDTTEQLRRSPSQTIFGAPPPAATR